MEQQIQAYLRVAASRGRDVHRIGPFLATFDPGEDNRYQNYAIPDEGAAPSREEVAALVAAYRERGRVPRLEYSAGLAPAVEGALLAAGFSSEGQIPLMVCRPGYERQLEAPEGIELLLPTTPDELYGVLAAQSEAFGGDGKPDQPGVERLRDAIGAGQIVVYARDAAGGEPAGGGVCTAPHDGLSEVAGVGVRSPYRRRGIAAALTARLVGEAFAAGVTLAFLMAASEREARIYARAGFSSIGEMLHISLL